MLELCKSVAATMRFSILAILVGMLVVASPQVSVAGERIRIGIIGDQTYTPELRRAYEVLKQGVEALNAEAPDVVLHVGDVVESTAPEDAIRTNFDEATTVLNQLAAPWFLTAGDHDVNPPVFAQGSSDRSREILFKQLYTRLNPRVSQNLFYSFEIKTYHFIALYSGEQLNADPRWGNVFFAQLSDEQLSWLENDLSKNANGKDGVIVFLHQPLWYNWAGWSRVHAILSRHNVKAVIAGHFHYNQVDTRIDGIEYRVVGATGGQTKGGSPNAGELQHVTLLSIDDQGNSEFRLLPLSPYSQIAWTPRAVMDRIQAVETVLDNIYQMQAASPLYLQNGKVVSACGGMTAGKIVLPQIGNALAQPLDVAIRVIGDGVKVSSATFEASLCSLTDGGSQCRMVPSAGVSVSNSSMVVTAMNSPPLWTGQIVATTPAPTPGSKVSVSVEMSFIQENQVFSLRRIGTLQINPCPQLGRKAKRR